MRSDDAHHDAHHDVHHVAHEHSQDGRPRLSVTPPLAPGEAELVAALAGADPRLVRIWRGQPRRRSPWLPCPDGCCLLLRARSPTDAVAWVRFLVREVLTPTSAAALRRAGALGLPGGHRLEGRVEIGAQRVSVAGTRVRVGQVSAV